MKSPSLREKLSQFDPALPLQQASTIPSTWYTDPEFFQAECELIFGRSWQLVARLDQFREHGSFVTAEIGREPVVVLQGGDASAPQLIGFYNVCRHRAATLLSEPHGRCARIRCPYHGWTYDLAGKLIGTPEFDGVQEFCRTDNGLVPIRATPWGPFAWANLNNDAAPLQQFLEPFPQHAAKLNLESLKFLRRTEYELHCNWKVFVDNYLDGGYHVNSVHPALAGVLDYAQYHTNIAGNTAVQTSPIKQQKSTDPTVAEVRTGDTAYYWWIFPNLMLNIYAGVMDTNLVLPIAPDRCRVIFDYYFAESESDPARQFMEDSIRIADQIQQEDIGICEQVQKGLQSRSYSTGRFSVRREVAAYHFHQLLAKWLTLETETEN